MPGASLRKLCLQGSAPANALFQALKASNGWNSLLIGCCSISLKIFCHSAGGLPRLGSAGGSSVNQLGSTPSASLICSSWPGLTLAEPTGSGSGKANNGCPLSARTTSSATKTLTSSENSTSTVSATADERRFAGVATIAGGLIADD